MTGAPSTLRARWGAACVVALATPAFPAAVGVSPYVEYGIEHESNLFRLPDGESTRSTSGGRGRADTIQHGTIGVLVDWPTSRQRFVAGAEASEFRYNRFERLDHSETEAHAAWEFEAGPAFHGTLSYRQDRRLDDFTDREGTQPDFVRQREPQAEAFLEVTPHWRVRTRAGHLRLDHSLESEQRFDRREIETALELQYVGAPGSVLGAGVEVIDGEFPGRDADDPLSRNFRQDTAFVSADWAYSGISRFRGQLGYTQRDGDGRGDDNNGNRDFDGITGRLGYERTFSAKTRASLELFRQIFSVNDVEANFVRETGGTLQLAWTYSPKLELTAQIGRREQDYQTLADAASRRDIVDEFTAELIYQPYLPLALIFNASGIQRDSTEAGETFDEFVGGVAVRLTLDSDALR